jgi:hypothetical protein
MNKENDMNPSAPPLVHLYPYRTKDGRYYAVSFTDLLQDAHCAPNVSKLFDSFGELKREADSKWPNRKWHPIHKDRGYVDLIVKD